MQNFTTSLNADLIKKKIIFLPAGKAKFTLIDVRDIGAVAAKILTATSEHLNKSYELTSDEKLSFKDMAGKLSTGLNVNIQYKSPNLLAFFLVKAHEGKPFMLILVMIMLHYLPRFQKEPLLTDWVQKITGSPPGTFGQFIDKNRSLLTRQY